MGGTNDLRGCPRLQWDGSRITVIPLASRSVDTDVIYSALNAWYNAKQLSDYGLAQGWDSSRPKAYQLLVAKTAAAQAALTRLLRAGNAGDEP